MSQWITHDGGKRPVHPDVLVTAYYERYGWYLTKFAQYLNWEEFPDRRSRVTAYQVIEPYKGNNGQ